MDFLTEINSALDLGFEEFKMFVQRKLQVNKGFLEQFFWMPGGSQMTLLNYLIQEHQEPKENAAYVESDRNLLPMIDYVLELAKDKNVGAPLHQAIASGKIQLALHLLGAEQHDLIVSESSKFNAVSLLVRIQRKATQLAEKLRNHLFDVDKRDNDGRTLVSLVLDSKNTDLLIYLLSRRPNIHETTRRTPSRVDFQPIHQAVVLDFADGIRLLASAGAQLANPLGAMKDTPVCLAARLGKINALEALLEEPSENLAFEVENNHLTEENKTGYTAIEELCERISNDKDMAEALRGVAMLLCRGAEPPRNETMRKLLSSNRVSLLKVVDQYLADKPELVEAFVNRCHLREDPLHNIVYADHSWGSSIRHLFGQPSEAAFLVEGLVSKKYENPKYAVEKVSSLSANDTENLLAERNPQKLYAEFVRRYTQAYDSQLFTNRWSTMRWMIAEGNCDWETVVRYSRNYPTSRTRIVINEMFNPASRIHDDIDRQAEGSGPALKVI